MEQLKAMVAGKKVAFIGAGVSHKPCITMLAALGADITLCDQKKSLDDFGDYADTLRRLLKILIIVLSVICAAISAYVYIFVIYDKTTPFSIAKIVPLIPFIAQLLLLLITLLTAGTSKRRPIGAALKENIQIKQEVKEKEKDEKISKEISDHLLEPEVALNTTKRTVELSSFQLISMRKSPKVAVVTNVTPNHLDHHKDMQEYIDAKRNILLWQEPPCRAVLGYENDITSTKFSISPVRKPCPRRNLRRIS
ncbi:MAG: hypothetical protein BHV97_03120 [Clostridium sp. CAG:349_48_7]|nr:MAG: hypothetical protein BHV97_03120 [Clostridium sp. CAG:349_48_7]